MFKNIFYDTSNSIIHLWGQKEGKNTYEQIEWVPYVYEHYKLEDDVPDIRSIYGDPVVRRCFNTYSEYKVFQEENYEIFENSVSPATQFLSEEFFDSTDETAPALHIAYLDIECPKEDGFPNVDETAAEVCLITIVDEKGKITTFGIGEYEGEYKGTVDYKCCTNERVLLTMFFKWMQKQAFDVLSGWNIALDSKKNQFGGFDIPYLIRRTSLIFGEKTDLYKKLSPINQVRIWKQKNVDGVYNVSIAGVTIIDYLGLYKWFTTKNLEAFKLDYVAKEELGKSKLDYSEYDSMYQFYQQDWHRFVDYNIKDSLIVKELEDKLRYLKLAQTMTLLCCVPMNQYSSSVGLIEGVMLKYYRNNNLCAPYLAGGAQEHFPAAYVKEPQRGLHKDVVDLDITSSYPTHQIIMNMSNETYIGRIVGFEPDHVQQFKKNSGIHEELHEGRPIYDMVVGYNREKEYPQFIMLKENKGMVTFDGIQLKSFNKALENNLISIAPCGSVFKNKPEGVYSKVVKETFFERKKQKGLKGEAKTKERAATTDEDKKYWKERSEEKHVLQWAIKILINSFFGVTGVPYSRYFNVNISEAITSGGRHTIKMGQVFVNELLNKPDDALIGMVDDIRKLCEVENG